MTIGLLVGRLFSFFWALYIIPLLVRLHYFCWEFSCYSYFGSLVTSFVARCFQDFLAFVSIVMCYLWFSLCLYYLEFVKLPACVHYCFPVNLGHVQLSVLFSSLPGTPTMCMLVCLMMLQISLRICSFLSFFSLLFGLHNPCWFIFIIDHSFFCQFKSTTENL